jgi:sigma-B regulation protein RsbU (phosphoserine phosphatase)
MDSKGVLFGEERMMDALKAVRAPEPHALCSVVRTVVAAFSEGLPQADDITVLAIRYFEPPKLYSRTFPPRQEGIADASAFLDETLEKSAAQVPEILSLAPPLHVILDEICSNIVKHSDATNFGVGIEIKKTPPGVKMMFIDDGTAYDPLAHIDPDTTLPAEERPIGGLGILMVKKMSTALSYHRANGRNILHVERTV